MSLGLQIAIVKTADDGRVVQYSYNTRGNDPGLVQINRATGDVALLRPSPDDAEGLLFSRVAYKLRKHWDVGNLPERTFWAS